MFHRLFYTFGNYCIAFVYIAFVLLFFWRVGGREGGRHAKNEDDDTHVYHCISPLAMLYIYDKRCYCLEMEPSLWSKVDAKHRFLRLLHRNRSRGLYRYLFINLWSFYSIYNSRYLTKKRFYNYILRWSIEALKHLPVFASFQNGNSLN